MKMLDVRHPSAIVSKREKAFNRTYSLDCLLLSSISQLADLYPSLCSPRHFDHYTVYWGESSPQLLFIFFAVIKTNYRIWLSEHCSLSSIANTVKGGRGLWAEGINRGQARERGCKPKSFLITENEYGSEMQLDEFIPTVGDACFYA